MEGWTVFGLLLGLFLLCVSLFSVSLLIRQLKTLRYIYLTAAFTPPRIDASFMQVESLSYSDVLKRLMPVYGLAHYQSVQFDLPPAAHLILYAFHLSLLWTLNLAIPSEEFAPQYAILCGFIASCTVVGFTACFVRTYVASFNIKLDRGSPNRGTSKVRSISPVKSVNRSPTKSISPSKSAGGSPNKSISPIKSARQYNEMLKRLGRSPTKITRSRHENIDGTTTFDDKPSTATGALRESPPRKYTAHIEAVLGGGLIGICVCCFWAMCQASIGDSKSHYNSFLQWLIGVVVDYPIRFAASGLIRHFSVPYEQIYQVQSFYLQPSDLPLYIRRKPDQQPEPSIIDPSPKPALFHISEESNSPLRNHFPFYPTPENSSPETDRQESRLQRRYNNIIHQFEVSEPDHEEFSIFQLMPIETSPRAQLPIYHPEVLADRLEMMVSPTKFCLARVPTSIVFNESPSPERPYIGSEDSYATDGSNTEVQDSEDLETQVVDESYSYREEMYDEVEPESLNRISSDFMRFGSQASSTERLVENSRMGSGYSEAGIGKSYESLEPESLPSRTPDLAILSIRSLEIPLECQDEDLSEGADDVAEMERTMQKLREEEEEQKRLKDEEEQRIKDEEEQRLKEQEMERIRDEQEQRLKDEEELRLKAEQDQRETAAKMKEEKRKLKEKRRLKAEKQRLKAEKLKSDQELRLKAEVEQKLKEEHEQQIQAETALKAAQASMKEVDPELSCMTPEPYLDSNLAFHIVKSDFKQSQNQSDAILEDIDSLQAFGGESPKPNPPLESTTPDIFRVFAELNHQTFDAEDTLLEPGRASPHRRESIEFQGRSRARRPPTGKSAKEVSSMLISMQNVVQDWQLEAESRLRHKSLLSAKHQGQTDRALDKRSGSLQPRRSKKIQPDDLKKEAAERTKIGLINKNFKRKKTRREIEASVEEILALQSRGIGTENESTLTKLRILLEAKQAFKQKHLPIRESSPYSGQLLRKNSREENITPNLVYLDEEYKRKQDEKLKSISSIYQTNTRGRKSKTDL